MSVAGLSSTHFLAPHFHLPASFSAARNNFQQLSQALQSGDLAGAQQAYANLTSNKAGTQSSQSQIAEDFSNLGQSLQAGDLSGAQNTFATLQQDLKSRIQSQATSYSQAAYNFPNQSNFVRRYHGYHGNSGTDSSAPAPQITINVSESNAGGDQITLNLPSNSNQSPEQVTINFAGGNSNSAPEQVTLNLGGGNETITLNFGATSGTATDTTAGSASSTSSVTENSANSTAGRVVNVTG